MKEIERFSEIWATVYWITLLHTPVDTNCHVPLHETFKCHKYVVTLSGPHVHTKLYKNLSLSSKLIKGKHSWI